MLDYIGLIAVNTLTDSNLRGCSTLLAIMFNHEQLGENSINPERKLLVIHGLTNKNLYK